MKKTLFSLFLVGLVCIVSVCAEAVTYKFTSIDYPEAVWTQANDIDGSNILGYYQDGVVWNTHGFLHDGTNFIKTFDYNGASVYPRGIDGNNVVGDYYDETTFTSHGFFYDGINWTTLEYIDEHGVVRETSPLGINGQNIVGSVYIDKGYGFLYNGGVWTLLDAFGPHCGIYASGIDGLYIVGNYYDCVRSHGFLYDISAKTYYPLPDHPDAVSIWYNNIDGNNMVGYYDDAAGKRHGFLYNTINSKWTTLDYPGDVDTLAFGIDGDKIVGRYEDSTGTHGFLAEPDQDGDGIPDSIDQCPGTEQGALVNANGCSGPQYVDTVAPCNASWKNHGDYVSAVAHAVKEAVKTGLITEAQKGEIVSKRAATECGQPSGKKKSAR